MSDGRWALRAVAVVALLAPVLGQAASATGSLEGNSDYASALIYASGRDYLDAYRAFRRAYRSNRDVGVIWYNMGLAAAHVPGYEFRAAALLRAYELNYRDGGVDPTIEGAIRSLEVTGNAEIDALLQAVAASNSAQATMAPAVAASCYAREAAIESAQWEAKAGHLAAANRLIKRGESRRGCNTNMAYGLALSFGYSGHFAAAATYSAMLDRRDLSFQFYQQMALRNIEFNHMGEARADERVALAKAQALKGNDALAGSYSAPEARLMYCVDSEWQWRTGFSPIKDRTRLANWRNLDFSRRRYPDNTLMRIAATYAAEGDYGWADVTAGAINNIFLKGTWQGYRVPDVAIPTAYGQQMMPLEASDQITTALQREPELLRCLGNSYFSNLLLRIGTGQVRFRSCPVTDGTLASCMHTIETARSDVRTRSSNLDNLLGQVLRLRTTVFEHRWYEHSS